MRANRTSGCHPLGRLLLGVGVLAGCDPSATLGQRSEVDSAGVSIIRLPEAERRLSWRFDTAFDVGGASDTTILVGRLVPGQVAGTEAGAVLLLDTQGSRVVMLDSLGRRHREFGSPGAGPGELRLPTGLAATADAGPVVVDVGKTSLLQWDSGGTLVFERRLPVLVWGRQIGLIGQGLVLMTRDGNTEDGRVLQKLVLVHDDSVREITSFTWPPTAAPQYASCPEYGVEAPPYFAPRLLWSPHRDLVAVVDSELYRIDVFRGDTLIRSIRRDVQPVPVTPSLAVDEVEELVVPRLGCTITPDELVRGRGHHSTFPLIARVSIGPDGLMWILRNAPGRREHRSIDIVSIHGDYVGTLPPQTPFPISFAGTDRFVELTEDSLDVPVIRLLKIEDPEG